MAKRYNASSSKEVLPLGLAKRGYCGTIEQIDAGNVKSSLGQIEIERRLIELGFVEGAQVEILHEGLFGRDPIAVRVDSSKVALRRHEAMAIFVTDDAQ